MADAFLAYVFSKGRIQVDEIKIHGKSHILYFPTHTPGLTDLSYRESLLAS